jgi:hypothetical protein
MAVSCSLVTGITLTPLGGGKKAEISLTVQRFAFDEGSRIAGPTEIDRLPS